jgi:hypothetical protein
MEGSTGEFWNGCWKGIEPEMREIARIAVRM